MAQSSKGWLAAAACLCFALPAGAATQGYTTLADFEVATASLIDQVTNFDGLGAGAAIAGGDGFVLSVSAGGLNAVVADVFWTTSDYNYLGLDGGDGQFIQGDTLTFALAADARAFGLSLIGGADMRDFADVGVRMQGGGLTFESSKLPEQQDGQGSFAFFLGVVSDAPLGSVTVSGYSPGFMQYAVDDVRVAAVPEPAAALLLLGGLAALAVARRRFPVAATTASIQVCQSQGGR